MKKVVILAGVFLFMIGQSNIVSAQVKTTYLPSFENLVKGKSLKEGLNLIYTFENGNKVYANKIAGKEPEYLFKKNDGSIIPPVTTTTVEKGARRCWKCIPGANGDVDCFMIPCPAIIRTGKGSTL